MAVKLADVLARTKAAEPELEDARLQRLVLETIAACGLEVARDGQVYNPAEGAYRPQRQRVVPREQRFSTRRR